MKAIITITDVTSEKDSDDSVHIRLECEPNGVDREPSEARALAVEIISFVNATAMAARRRQGAG